VSGVKPLASASGRDDEAASANLAGALHEVSNALTVVLGWLDAAKIQLAAHAAHEAIEVALAHARLGHAIARRAIGAESEASNVTRSALSVARDAALGVAQEALRCRVAIDVEDRTVDDLLVGSAPVAQQILINLLLNAVHFSPQGSRVVLAVERLGDRMHFHVIDRGPGIAPERIETLFSSPDSTRRGGAGIGLRHASGLAEAHGGELRLRRTGPRGSDFELAWPVGEAPSCVRRTIPPQSLDGLRVLLLEDDPAISALIDIGLSGRGAQVATARTLGDLKLLLERGVFDVMLVDLSPLGDDPMATLCLFDRLDPAPAVVIISGSVAPQVDAPCVDAWVRKPFEIVEIVDALTRLPRPR